MGEVLLAEDTRLERRVAIKLLPSSAEADPVARERLRREALAAASLDHPFICKVYEIGDADGREFIVMEYIEGETLHAATRRALLPLNRVLDIAHDLAQALDAAHRRGIVHRDLKPANVMITTHGHVKVMDFGLAKQTVATGAHAGLSTADPQNTQLALTDSGTRLGTPAYMSPEQVLGGGLDPRSDIFSLGVILHELATGRHPFLRDEPADTMAAILRDPPARGSRDADEVVGFSTVIGRMLAKACAERHQTTGELLADLEALRDRARSSSARGAVATPAQPAERTPFVGRDAEAGELRRLLDRMLTGQGGMVLIGGEPGVGKTRLARELLAAARERGCICLTGHCYEMEGAPPFMPFVEIVEQTVHMVPQAARAAMGEYAAEIAAMVPSLRRSYSDIPPLPDVPTEQQRRLIFGAFLEYIRRGNQKSPGVFLLDDLHWADEPTLQLLLHTAPHIAQMRLLVVGTYRDVELDVKRPFAKTLESLLRQRFATRIALRRLDESGVLHLLSAMSGSPAPSGLVKAVFRETEGNPFFIEEVYQHLSEEGKLFDASGAWKTDLRVDTIEVPEGVRLVIGRRLDRLGEQARKVLTAAAVIGRTFPLDLLGAIVDVSEDDVLEAVEEAEGAQLVAAETSQRTPRYGFVHELIRTTLVNGLSLPRRQRLHLKIADALERLRAASLESQASVLAHHLYQAGAAADAQRTAKALKLAGTRALAAAAFEEGLETFDNLIALELTEDDPLLAAACEHRGHALFALGRHEESVAAYDRALTIYSALGDDSGIGRAAFGEGNNYAWRGFVSEARAPLARGLQALSPQAERERGLLLSWLAATLMTRATVDEGMGHMAEAVAIAERLDDPAAIGRILFGQAASYRMVSRSDQAIAIARRALTLTPPTALWARADLLSGLLVDEYYCGHFATCEELLPQLEAVARPAGHGGALFFGRMVRFYIDVVRSGRMRAALPQLAELIELPNFRYITRAVSASFHLYLGEVDTAFAELDAAIKEMSPAIAYWGGAQGARFAGTALAGQHGRARALAEELTTLLPVGGRTNVQGAYAALNGLVTGLALLGERERCGRLYPLAEEATHTGWVSPFLGPVNPQLAAALAADAAGLVDRAHEHFETALRQAREVPIRILQPSVLYWYGRSLGATTDDADRARGRAMIEAALEDFRALEMVLHVRLAEEFLRS